MILREQVWLRTMESQGDNPKFNSDAVKPTYLLYDGEEYLTLGVRALNRIGNNCSTRQSEKI